jgi:hypothetical protein
MREFAGKQGFGVEDDFAGVTNEGAVLQYATQFRPADGGAVFLVKLETFGGDVRGEGLAGVVSC